MAGTSTAPDHSHRVWKASHITKKDLHNWVLVTYFRPGEDTRGLLFTSCICSRSIGGSLIVCGHTVARAVVALARKPSTRAACGQVSCGGGLDGSNSSALVSELVECCCTRLCDVLSHD
jgi:hypothetical protein